MQLAGSTRFLAGVICFAHPQAGGREEGLDLLRPCIGFLAFPFPSWTRLEWENTQRGFFGHLLHLQGPFVVDPLTSAQYLLSTYSVLRRAFERVAGGDVTPFYLQDM